MSVVFEAAGSVGLLCKESGVMIQGEMLVEKDLEWKHPKGAISCFWMSRADQSFGRTKPKIYSAASLAVTILPLSAGEEINATSNIEPKLLTQLQPGSLASAEVGYRLISFRRSQFLIIQLL